MKKNYILGVILLVIILVVVFLIVGSGTQNTGDVELAEYMDVSALEANELIENTPNLVVIDVSPHYAEGHLPGAINYYPSSELEVAVQALDKDGMYLVYCHADGPSRNGAQILIDAGLKNVYRLDSHFGGWKDAGYEIEV